MTYNLHTYYYRVQRVYANEEKRIKFSNRACTKIVSALPPRATFRWSKVKTNFWVPGILLLRKHNYVFRKNLLEMMHIIFMSLKLVWSEMCKFAKKRSKLMIYVFLETISTTYFDTSTFISNVLLGAKFVLSLFC